jgi:hypothetical protein
MDAIETGNETTESTPECQRRAPLGLRIILVAAPLLLLLAAMAIANAYDFTAPGAGDTLPRQLAAQLDAAELSDDSILRGQTADAVMTVLDTEAAAFADYPVERVLYRGRAFLLKGQLQDAAPLLNEAVARGPFHADATRYAALCAALRTPQPATLDEARALLAVCGRAERGGVLTPPVRLAYAAALGMVGDFSAALAQLDALPQAARGRAGALGDQLRGGARMVAATQQQLQEVSAKDPAGMGRFIAEAQAALARKDALAAFYRLERVTAKDPANGRAWELLALALLEMNDPAAAGAALDQAAAAGVPAERLAPLRAELAPKTP